MSRKIEKPPFKPAAAMRRFFYFEILMPLQNKTVTKTLYAHFFSFLFTKKKCRDMQLNCSL
jgi:hypothetical protein